MDPTNNSTSTEAELESFRRKWREEVSARTTQGRSSAVPAKTANVTASSSKSHAPKSNAPGAASHTHAQQRHVDDEDDEDESVLHVFPDLGGKQHGRRLDETSAQTAAALAAEEKPASALDHYERAVEKETQGSLGDSVSLYRKAFKVSPFARPHIHVLIQHSSTTTYTRHTRRSTSRPHSSRTNPSRSRSRKK